MKIRTAVSTGTAAILAMTFSLVGAQPAHAASTTPGSYHLVTQHRLLDTRAGTGAPKAALPSGHTLTFVATGGISGAVSSVVVNVTVVAPAAYGYLTVFAAGTPAPNASDLNFTRHQTVANMVVTPVGQTGASAGRVSVYNGSGGTVQLAVDIYGYFVGGQNDGTAGTLVTSNPTRFLDTRTGFGTSPTHAGQAAPLSVTRVKVAGLHGIPADAHAVVANLTAVNSPGKGYLTAYPTGELRPDGSHLNFGAHENRANLGLVEVGTDGTVSVFNGSIFPVDVLVDISGYFVGGEGAFTDGTFTPTAYRAYDTRLLAGGRATPMKVTKIPIFPAPAPGDATFDIIKAIVVNVTVVNPSTSGYLTTWQGGGAVPTVSNSNFQAGRDVAGTVIVPVNADGTISIYNGSPGTVDLVVDYLGMFVDLPTS